MSRVVAQAHEPVELDDRKAMTPARRKRIWEARKGVCWMCGKPVPQSGPEVVYDHHLPLDLGGSDDDDNIRPIHREPCDRIKTASDRRRIDKHRRQQKLSLSVPRTVSPSWGKQRKFPEARRVPVKGKT